MRWKRYLLFTVPAVMGIALGFFLGSVVFAGGVEPGSVSDPLVARSYVDEQVKSYISELEGRITALNARALQLEKELAELQARSGLNPITPGETSEPGSGTTNPGGDTPAPGSGKKVVYIKEGNSYVNLRSGPGTNHEIVGKALPGEPMAVIGQEGDWYQVSLSGGKTAWIAAWLVSAPS